MRDIKLLHHKLKAKCLQLISLSKQNGIDIMITQTLRNQQEQNDLYAQGRTKPGKIVTKCKHPQSPHCWGLAFDFAVMKNGQVVWTDAAAYQKVGQLAKSLGLFWGGDFKTFVDMPHIEDPEFVIGQSVNNLLKKYRTPEKFMATWKDKDEVNIQQTIILEKTSGKKLAGIMMNGVSYLQVNTLRELGKEVTWNAMDKQVEIKI
jgi:peptidoglycan L-alanyl-D-glutamate endopeptidase CwlK